MLLWLPECGHRSGSRALSDIPVACGRLWSFKPLRLLWQDACTYKRKRTARVLETRALNEMRKTKLTRSKARFWTILTAVNIVAIGYVLGLHVRADSSDEQLFAAIALIFVAFFVAIADIVSILLTCEVWLDERR